MDNLNNYNTTMLISMQTYETHDNGGRPFKVEIDPEENNNTVVRVYYKNEEMQLEPIVTFDAKKVFVGKSPINNMTNFSGGHGFEFDGNSILLELNENQYEFIGDKIFSFTSLNKIVDYISPVGNSDVPYPYAIDENGNVYLLIENVVLKSTESLKSHIENTNNDPYNYYYKLCVINKSKNADENYEYIESFLIGKEKYVLSYVQNPEENYLRLKNKGKIYLNKKYSMPIELTKEMYVDLMTKFGEFIHVESIKDIHIDAARL